MSLRLSAPSTAWPASGPSATTFMPSLLRSSTNQSNSSGGSSRSTTTVILTPVSRRAIVPPTPTLRDGAGRGSLHFRRRARRRRVRSLTPRCLRSTTCCGGYGRRKLSIQYLAYESNDSCTARRRRQSVERRIGAAEVAFDHRSSIAVRRCSRRSRSAAPARPRRDRGEHGRRAAPKRKPPSVTASANVRSRPSDSAIERFSYVAEGLGCDAGRGGRRVGSDGASGAVRCAPA